MHGYTCINIDEFTDFLQTVRQATFGIFRLKPINKDTGKPIDEDTLSEKGRIHRVLKHRNKQEKLSGARSSMQTR